MDSTGLLEQLRTDLFDLEEPYLWSDEELIRYIDDAQFMFCRKTDGIPDDFTADVCELAVTPGTDRVALHPSIRLVRAAARDDTGAPVEVLNTEDMPRRGYRFNGVLGSPKALVLGGSAHSARVWPVSSETFTLRLTVFRMPLAHITDTDQAFEIDEEHHTHLGLWCMHRAYLKQDAETLDKDKSAEFEARFLNYCASVTREEQRKRHKTRVVSYGGL